MILSAKIFFSIISLGVVIHGEPYVNERELDAFTRQKRAVIQTKFKFETPVKYYIGPFLNYTSIYLAIKRIEEKTCIKFRQEFWYIKGTRGFNFKRSYICHSPFGPKVDDKNYENYVLLSHKCEHNVGVIEILIGTMLGLVFEHNRPDRDYYVIVNRENIIPLHNHDFDRYKNSEVETYGLLYDFYSGLHIFSKNFSKNGKAVLERNSVFKIHGLGFGQAYGLSFNDYKTLFKRYCESHEHKHGHRHSHNWHWRRCQNFGYLESKKHGNCICPTGFEGAYCDDPIVNYRACDSNGHNSLYADHQNKTIKLGRKGRCSYHIRARGFRIAVRIHIIVSKTPNTTTCYPDKGHEIKYQWDKGTTGLTLCGVYRNIDIISDDNFAVIIYNGVDENSKLEFTYSIYNYRSTTVPPQTTTTPTTTSITTTTSRTTTKRRKPPKKTKKPKPQNKPSKQSSKKSPKKSKKNQKKQKKNKVDQE
uniref:Metalloendopeptidase n=1 Tax=Strongyloides papillosus TaxID=174720 RepID=A0A0N5BL87_STREA